MSALGHHTLAREFKASKHVQVFGECSNNIIDKKCNTILDFIAALVVCPSGVAVPSCPKFADVLTHALIRSGSGNAKLRFNTSL